MFLSLHLPFSLARAVVVWAILETENIRFGSFIRDDWSQVHWVLHCFFDILSWSPFGRHWGCSSLSSYQHHFRILWWLYPDVLPGRQLRLSSAAFTTMSSAKRKLLASLRCWQYLQGHPVPRAGFCPGRWEQTPLSDSNCSSESVFCTGIEQDLTLSFV